MNENRGDKRLLGKIVSKIATKIKQLFSITRSKAWQLSSSEYCGEELKICFIGSEIQKNFIKKALFPQAPMEQHLGARLFYKLSPIFLFREFDLTIVERLYPDQLPRIEAQHWDLPFWVHSYVDLPISKPGNSYRSDLRLIRNNDLSYRVTTDPSEIQEFYTTMYLPLVQQRHGDSVIPMHHRELLETIETQQGELVLVVEDDRPIAGMVIDYRGELPNLWSMGVLNADSELMGKAATPAAYHFSYVHLHSLGYSRVSLGLCRAFIDDGVLKFKRKFRPKLLNATDRSFVFIPGRVSKAMCALLKKNAFIQTKKGKLGLVTFVESKDDSDEVQAAQQKRLADLELGSSEVYSVSECDIQRTSEAFFSRSHLLTRSQPAHDLFGRDQYTQAAIYLLRHLMRVKNESSMLLYGDELSDPGCLSVIESASTELGVRVDRLTLNPEHSLVEQSDEITKKLQETSYELVCEASGQYFYQTPSWREARATGARCFSLGPLDLESLRDCVGGVDHHKVFFLAERIAQLIEDSSCLTLSDQNGSELSIQFDRPLKNKLLSRVKLAQPHYSIVHKPTGILTKDANSTFLGGQLSFLGYPPGINGRVVIDGFLWPPKQLGALRENVVLDIVKGKIVSISGGAAAKLFEQRQPISQRGLEHICIGLNPGARMQKNLMEAERAFGACNFGFGGYPYHTDGVVSKPTLFVDSIPLIENGVLRQEL